MVTWHDRCEAHLKHGRYRFAYVCLFSLFAFSFSVRFLLVCRSHAYVVVFDSASCDENVVDCIVVSVLLD